MRSRNKIQRWANLIADMVTTIETRDQYIGLHESNALRALSNEARSRKEEKLNILRSEGLGRFDKNSQLENSDDDDDDDEEEQEKDADAEILSFSGETPAISASDTTAAESETSAGINLQNYHGRYERDAAQGRVRRRVGNHYAGNSQDERDG